ncbi:hypothetical protein [Actibacterium ureilyticum]|uniref:hypothetical protein n=1 Tax=Actibacterium ureilyticum TaxID=1590614 RepID=UPI000BAAEF4E|nr:hypothetical protein [Actibacterium ureilyticum]
MTGLNMRSGATILAAALTLAGCADYAGAPKSETAAVSRLAQQGFKIVSDGRGSDAATALRYSGPPTVVIQCGRPGGKYATTDQARTVTLPNGRTARESGVVDAYVIVENDGSLRGLYVNTLTRELRTASGRRAGRAVEIVEFPPNGRAQFRDGLVCRPRF